MPSDNIRAMKTVKLIATIIGMGIIVLLFRAGISWSHDLVFPAEKLKALYPQAESFEQKNLYISDEQQAVLEKALGSRLPEEDLKPSIYFAIVKPDANVRPRKEAVIMFVDALGDGGKIEMGIAVNGKGELVKIRLFENKEPQTLSRDSFLKQFQDKKPTDSFTVGKDITAPPGAGKAAQAIASGARRGLLIITELFRKK